MNLDETQYEETIDLKELGIFILRKWRILLIVMLAGAVVFGAWKAVKVPEPVTPAAKVLEDNQKKIDANQKTIQNNERTLSRDLAEIQTQEASIANLEKILITYQEALTDAQNLLNETLTAEDRVTLVGELADLNGSILNVNNQLTAARQKITSLNDEITALQNDMEIVKKDIAALEESMEGKPVVIGTGDIIRFSVLGAFAGALGVCGIAFLQFFFCKKLRNENELKERYGYRILSNLYTPTGKTGVIDQMLNRMAGYGKKPDEDREYALAAAGIQVMTSEEKSETGKRQVLITGTVDLSVITGVCEQIQKSLPADQYELCPVSNPVYTAEAMLQIRQKDIVLVEAKDISNRQEISRLAELLKAGKARVVGAILL